MCMILCALLLFKKEKGVILDHHCCFLCRKRLFSMINELPTVFEVVTERKHVKEQLTADSGSRSRGSTKVGPRGQQYNLLSVCPELVVPLY